MKENSKIMVETKDLVKVYRTGGVRFEALRGVSLKIKKGELVSILGPSGSGKSTLLHIMGLLDRPSSGRVYIEGKDTSKIDEKGLAEMRNRRIGFVFQAFNLIHRLNSVENIELPLISQGIDPVSRREHAVKMLDMVGLASKSLNRPAELSGGEQQRVAIARALVTNPAIVLADEPTGNLDSKTAMQIMDIVGKVNESLGTSFVIVTHNFEVAARTHRRIILRDGQVEREEDV
ncbi:MAG: ABC transporter ATP-binding protein [Candidatus Bathyarchaeia archaeon]